MQLKTRNQHHLLQVIECHVCFSELSLGQSCIFTQVLQGMKEQERLQLDAVKLRRKARDFANKTVKSQKAQFQRYVPDLPQEPDRQILPFDL